MITLAAFFTLFTSTLTAGNDYTYTTPVPVNTIVTSLAPVAPSVATFEETAISPETLLLTPSVPAEAGFEELPATLRLAPEVPATADFE